MVNSKKTKGFWIMSSLLSLILILSLSTIILSGEVKLTQFASFATVSALSVSLFKEIPSLSKIKYLKPMMITLAILILGLGIYTEWINK